VVTVLPITRTSHDLPTRVEIEPQPANGLDEILYARCEDVRSISDQRLVRRIGHVDATILFRVKTVLGRFLEI